MIQVTATDFKSNLGKYLALAAREDIAISKNGTRIAVLTAPKTSSSWVDELIGIIPSSPVDTKESKTSRLVEKYESIL